MEKQHPSHHLARVMHVSKRNEEGWDQFVKTIDGIEDNSDRNVVIAGFQFLRSSLAWWQFKKNWYLSNRLQRYKKKHPAK